MILPVLLIFIIFFIFALAHPGNKNNMRRSGPRSECAIGARTASQELYYPPPKPAAPSVVAPKFVPENMSNAPHPDGQDDYNQFIINTGLETSVVDSHRVFAKEINTSTSGASAETVFSHDDSIVPKWGLRRTNARIPVSENAREVPSSTDEQLDDNSHSLTYGLF